MEHSFDIDLAREYGMLEAVLLKHFKFWIDKNIANEKNFYDGTYWTYNSIKAFTTLFPYASESTIKRALKRLQDLGIIQTGNYNKIAYDRTLWYAFTQYGQSIMSKRQMEEVKSSNGLVKNDEPIPDNNTYINTNKNTVAEIQKCYEQNVGLLTPATAEILFDYTNEIDYKMVIEAIKIATINNKRNTRYIQGILNSWINKGFKVLADIEQENKKEIHKEETEEEKIQRKIKEVEAIYNANK